MSTMIKLLMEMLKIRLLVRCPTGWDNHPVVNIMKWPNLNRVQIVETLLCKLTQAFCYDVMNIWVFHI